MLISFSVDRREDVLATFKRIVSKSGIEGASIVFDENVTFIQPVADNPDFKVAIMSAEIVIPACNGWNVIAKLEALEAGNVIRSFTNKEVPAEFWHGTKCDHCNVNRYRKESYLVEKEGLIRQVGSTCLDEFTDNGFNHLFYKGIRDLAEYCEDNLSGGGGWIASYPIEKVLAVTEGVIRAYGWIPSSQAREEGCSSTSGRVWAFLNPGKNGPDRSVVPSEDLINVNAAISWARNLTDEEIGSSSYLHNVKVVASCSYVLDKNLGIVVSIITAYARIQAKVREARSPKVVQESNYVGTVGKREDFSLTFTKRMTFDNDFGCSHMHLFKDAQGNVFKWSTASYLDIKEGDVILLKGTIKSHEEYKNVKQTILSRCKFLKMLQEAALEVSCVCERECCPGQDNDY